MYEPVEATQLAKRKPRKPARAPKPGSSDLFQRAYLALLAHQLTLDEESCYEASVRLENLLATDKEGSKFERESIERHIVLLREDATIKIAREARDSGMKALEVATKALEENRKQVRARRVPDAIKFWLTILSTSAAIAAVWITWANMA